MKKKARRDNIIFSTCIAVEDNLRIEANMKYNIDIKARKSAFSLRSKIPYSTKNYITWGLNHKGHHRRRITSTEYY